MERYLMRYLGKKKEITITRPHLDEKYEITQGATINMTKRDADWFMVNDPAMFEFKGYMSPPIRSESVKAEKPPIVASDTTETSAGPKAEIISDIDNEGPLPGEPGAVEVNKTPIPIKTNAQLMSMKLAELIEFGDTLGIVVDDTLSSQKQRAQYIKGIKEKQAQIT
jgi:hypothetical protein